MQKARLRRSFNLAPASARPSTGQRASKHRPARVQQGAGQAPHSGAGTVVGLVEAQQDLGARRDAAQVAGAAVAGPHALADGRPLRARPRASAQRPARAFRRSALVARARHCTGPLQCVTRKQ